MRKTIYKEENKNNDYLLFSNKELIEVMNNKIDLISIEQNLYHFPNQEVVKSKKIWLSTK